jgi:putative DNA primase/helicase
MVAAIRKHVILSQHQALTVALWVMHAHAIDAAEHTPRLQIKSPTMRCGKTTVMNTIKPMLPKPVSTESITMAALFRVIAKWKPTLLIDEADSFLKREDGKDNEDLRGILNAGHGRSGAVIRTVGDEHEPRAFPVFGPVAYAWLVHRGRQVSETLADRSITIELRRRLSSEKITRLRSNRTDHLAILGRRAARWVSDHWADLTDADPSLPEGLSDRAQDNWRPLIAIADAMSAEIGKIARDAAITIAAERVDADVDAAIEALTDVAAIFEARGAEFLTSARIVDDLVGMVGMEDRPWAEWRRGRPITARGLAQLLKPFGIRPELTRPRGGGRPERGYTVQRIREAAERFVEQQPQEPEPEAQAPEGELPY